MSQSNNFTWPLRWLMATLLVASVTGCGGGGQDPILGGDLAALMPSVTAVSPTPRAVGVPINTTIITAAFSKAMDPASLTPASFTLTCPAGALQTGVVAYSANGNVATLTLDKPLPPSSHCSAVVTTGARDASGIPLVNDFTWTFDSAATTDSTAPTVTGTIHGNGQTNVAINTKIGATFSEVMDPASITSANFFLKETLSGVVVTGTVSYSGVNAVFIPLSNLAANTRYTVIVNGAPNGVRNLRGNPMAHDFVIDWTTGAAADTTAPTVTGSIHSNGQTNVAINTKIGVTFSEGMDPLSITNQNFSVKESVSGHSVAGTVSYSGVSATFIPNSDLALSTRYSVTVKGTPSGVRDLAGNLMASDFEYSWTTATLADTTPPTVILVNPADLATGVAISRPITATFSEAMDPLTVNTANFSVAGVTGLVSYDAIGKLATFTPSSHLASNTSYNARVTSGAQDLAGNALAADTVWRFTTAALPVMPPTITLGSVATYGTFGGSSGMTNQGTLTVINGDIGTIATTTSSITGFHDSQGDIFTETGANQGRVNGTIYTCTNSVTGPTSTGVNSAYCALATQASLDAQSAYLALAALPSDGVLAGNLAGTTLYPGVYTNASSVMVQGGDLSLDAQGDANAIFVFQIGSTFTLGGPGAAFPQSIILAGGAQAKNVFWVVGTFATINAGGGGTMVGSIISQSGASFSTAGNVTPVTLNGRVLSLGASITLVNTIINVPGS